MRALTADGTARTNVWITAGRVEAALQACLAEPLRVPLVFAPGLDWAPGADRWACRGRGRGAQIRRLVGAAALGGVGGHALP